MPFPRAAPARRGAGGRGSSAPRGVGAARQARTRSQARPRGEPPRSRSRAAQPLDTDLFPDPCAAGSRWVGPVVDDDVGSIPARDLDRRQERVSRVVPDLEACGPASDDEVAVVFLQRAPERVPARDVESEEESDRVVSKRRGQRPVGPAPVVELRDTDPGPAEGARERCGAGRDDDHGAPRWSHRHRGDHRRRGRLSAQDRKPLPRIPGRRRVPEGVRFAAAAWALARPRSYTRWAAYTESPMKPPRILAVASAIDLDFRYGCTPAWWQLWKGMYEAGADLVVTPYRGRPVESPWWRTAPNPTYTG